MSAKTKSNQGLPITMTKFQCSSSSRSCSSAWFALVVVALVMDQWDCLVGAFSIPQQSSSSAYDIIRTSTSLVDPQTGQPTVAFSENHDNDDNDQILVVLLPQLGEFDSMEYVEFLVAAQPALEQEGVSLCVIGIGNVPAGQQFCNFTGLDPTLLRLDPTAQLYRELELYAGPNLSIPSSISDAVLRFALNQLPGGAPPPETEAELLRPMATAWLKYLAMCAGIGAPGILAEILRGYVGDMSAPERFRTNAVVEAGLVTIGPGVGPVQVGPWISYQQYFADETGYQRPVELATVRLRNMVQVLTNWDTYVSNPLHIAQRGATYWFHHHQQPQVVYSYQSRGVLTYSETMARPLSFLAPILGQQLAGNPLNLPDTGGGEFQRGRGIWKPIGKALQVFSRLFQWENRWQSKLLGVDETDVAAATATIQTTVAEHTVVLYTYQWSPFSQEARAVLDELGIVYHVVPVGVEWFLLNKDQSAVRTALLEQTGQSSLPQIFVQGQHIGGLFTGTTDGSFPGLAALKESGELQTMV